MYFVTYLSIAATLLDQLEDDETARCAHRLGDFARIQLADHVVERRRQLTGFTPAHLAAFQRGFTGRTGNRQLGEVCALLQLLIHLLRLPLGGLDFAGGGALGNRNQDVGQTELFRQLHLAQVGGEEVLHFLVGDLDAFGHASLTHTADDHLAPHLITSIGIGQAITSQRFAELLQAHAVALGDGAHGLVQLFVGDTNAGAVANLQLDILDDQAFEHLLAEYVLRRQGATALVDGLLHFTQASVELALHDHVVVDDGHDAIQWAHLGLSRRRQQCCAQ